MKCGCYVQALRLPSRGLVRYISLAWQICVHILHANLLMCLRAATDVYGGQSGMALCLKGKCSLNSAIKFNHPPNRCRLPRINGCNILGTLVEGKICTIYNTPASGPWCDQPWCWGKSHRQTMIRLIASHHGLPPVICHLGGNQTYT